MIKIIKKEKIGEINQQKVWDEVESSFEPLDTVKDFLKNKKGFILDLGCGNGKNFVKSKGENEIKYLGVDFSKKQLSVAEKYAIEIGVDFELVKCGIDNLPNSWDEKFDYGLFIGSLHCLNNSEKRKKAVKEFYRVLKKEGEGFVSVWNSKDKRFNCVNNKGDIYMNWMKNKKEYFRYYYLFEKEEFLKLLEDAGFKVLEFVNYKDRFSRKNWTIKVKK